MMISPEVFYDLHMKGKGKEDILEEINAVKEEMKELKAILKQPGYQRTMFPDEKTRLSWNREYLAILKKALAE